MPLIINKDMQKKVQTWRQAAGLAPVSVLHAQKKNQEKQQHRDNKEFDETLMPLQMQLLVKNRSLMVLSNERSLLLEHSDNLNDIQVRLEAQYVEAGGKVEGVSTPAAEALKKPLETARENYNASLKRLQTNTIEMQACRKEIQETWQTIAEMETIQQASYADYIVENRFKHAVLQMVFNKMKSLTHSELRGNYTLQEFEAICKTGALYIIAMLEDRTSTKKEAACISAGWKSISSYNPQVDGLPSDFFSQLQDVVYSTYQELISNTELQSPTSENTLTIHQGIIHEVAQLRKQVNIQDPFMQKNQPDNSAAIENLTRQKRAKEQQLLPSSTPAVKEKLTKAIQRLEEQINELRPEKDLNLTRYQAFQKALLLKVVNLIKAEQAKTSSDKHAYGALGPLSDLDFHSACSQAAHYILSKLEGAPPGVLEARKLSCEAPEPKGWIFKKWDTPKLTGWPDSLFPELQKLVYDTYKTEIKKFYPEIFEQPSAVHGSNRARTKEIKEDDPEFPGTLDAVQQTSTVPRRPSPPPRPIRLSIPQNTPVEQPTTPSSAPPLPDSPTKPVQKRK